jgi:hypothetical protein
MPRTVESAETAERAWRKPEPQWTLTKDGQHIRVYVCRCCKDTGIVTLPPRQKGETGADLVNFKRLLAGKRYSYACPNCRPGERLCSKHPPLSEAQQRRLRMWLQARRVQLEREEAEGAHEPVKPGRLPQVGRPMPPLSLFAQEEARLEAAAAGGGEGD